MGILGAVVQVQLDRKIEISLRDHVDETSNLSKKIKIFLETFQESILRAYGSPLVGHLHRQRLKN